MGMQRLKTFRLVMACKDEESARRSCNEYGKYTDQCWQVFEIELGNSALIRTVRMEISLRGQSSTM
jgi:hypothetical protein